MQKVRQSVCHAHAAELLACPTGHWCAHSLVLQEAVCEYPFLLHVGLCWLAFRDATRALAAPAQAPPLVMEERRGRGGRGGGRAWRWGWDYHRDHQLCGSARPSMACRCAGGEGRAKARWWGGGGGGLTLTATVIPCQVPLKTFPKDPLPSRGPRLTLAKMSSVTSTPGCPRDGAWKSGVPTDCERDRPPSCVASETITKQRSGASLAEADMKEGIPMGTVDASRSP